MNLKTCPIQGRELVMPIGNGHMGLGVHVPSPGSTEGNDTLTTDGEYELTVTNTHGYLRITMSVPSRLLPFAVGDDPACSEPWVNYNGGSWGSNTLYWTYYEGTVPNYMSVSGSLDSIRSAVADLTQGVNNCGYTSVLNGHSSYSGDSPIYANIDSSGNCTSKFPDGYNAVSWGDYSDSSAPNTLAVTCWKYNSSATMYEADIRFGSNRGIDATLPSNCTNNYDLQSIATHEWGHAFGLAHETQGSDEVMYPTSYLCHLRRHLGQGDYDGMANLYGYR